MMKKILSMFFFLASGCTTVTMTPKGEQIISTPPTYETSLPFYLMGVVGEREIDVKEICGKRPLKQIQTQVTALDGLLTIVTLTIYTPSTAKVWCGPEGV